MSEVIPEGTTQKKGARPTLSRFQLGYDMAGMYFLTEVWAYSADDAQARVEAMRATLRIDNHVYPVMD